MLSLITLSYIFALKRFEFLCLAGKTRVHGKGTKDPVKGLGF